MASTYMNRTLTANNQKKLTISVWVKIAKVQEQMIVSSYSSGSLWGSLYFSSTGQLRFYDYRSSYILKLDSNALYRDTNAWMHIVANFDCSIGSPTAKLYVNGEEVSYATQTIYSQNDTTSWNTNYDFQIGKGSDLGGNQFDGQMSDLYFIQGYTYDASTFGETDSTSGIWKPKTNPTINYGGTGGNSCHLKFENSGNMDLDSGDNNVSLTTTGTLTQNVDTPSNNFATMNPLDNHFAGGTFSNGNNTVQTRNTGYSYNTSTIGMSSGKWYWEMKYASIDVGSGNQLMAGIAKSLTRGTTDHMGYRNTSYAYTSNGVMFNNNGTTSYGNTYAPNDIVGFALDLTNNKFYASINGTWQNSANPANNTGGHSITAPDADSSTDLGFYFVAVGDGNDGFQATVQYNFGGGYFGTTAVASAGTAPSEGGIFEYDCPSGYQALCTKGINSF